VRKASDQIKLFEDQGGRGSHDCGGVAVGEIEIARRPIYDLGKTETVLLWSTKALTRQWLAKQVDDARNPRRITGMATVASPSKIGSSFDPAMRRPERYRIWFPQG